MNIAKSLVFGTLMALGFFAHSASAIAIDWCAQARIQLTSAQSAGAISVTAAMAASQNSDEAAQAYASLPASVSFPHTGSDGRVWSKSDCMRYNRIMTAAKGSIQAGDSAFASGNKNNYAANMWIGQGNADYRNGLCYNATSDYYNSTNSFEQAKGWFDYAKSAYTYATTNYTNSAAAMKP
jgi:hypothetical protein